MFRGRPSGGAERVADQSEKSNDEKTFEKDGGFDDTFSSKKVEVENVSPEKQEIKNEDEDRASFLAYLATKTEKTDQGIERKSEVVKDTQDKLNQVRIELGLPVSDELPPSVKTEMDSIEKLKQVKESLDAKVLEFKESRKNEENKIIENKLKDATEDISLNSKTMLDALYERQQQGLTQIQDSDRFHMMVSGIKKLQNFDSAFGPESVSSLTNQINRLAVMFEEIQILRGSSFKESSENLEKLAYGVRRFSNSLQEDASKLSIEIEDPEMEDKIKELRYAMNSLAERSQILLQLVNRMRENL